MLVKIILILFVIALIAIAWMFLKDQLDYVDRMKKHFGD